MKKIVYSLSVLCVLLAIAAFTLLCLFLCASDGYNRACLERNDAQNTAYELKRENDYLKWEIEHPQKSLMACGQYENSWVVR